MDNVKKFIENIFTSMDGNISKITTILSEDWFSAGNTWYDFAKGIFVIVEPVALVIVSLCFFIEFLKITIQMDILKWEYGLKCFFKLVFAKVCIDVSTDLLSAIYATGAEWIASVGTSGSSIGATAWGVIQADIKGYGFIEMIGCVISVGIVVIAVWVISLVCQVIAYARKFELTLYLAIAPLPCAFLPLEDGGGSRIPKKFFMSFAGVCLQGLFMIMSVKLYEMLCIEFIENISGGDVFSVVGEVLLATVVLLMAVIKSGSWAKSILDAM